MILPFFLLGLIWHRFITIRIFKLKIIYYIMLIKQAIGKTKVVLLLMVIMVVPLTISKINNQYSIAILI